MISIIAGLDGTFSVAPPDLAWSGLRKKWTCVALRTCPSNASLHPYAWAKGGSPNGSTYNSVSSYASSPAGSPMLPYSRYSPASPPLQIPGRSPSGDTGSFHDTVWAQAFPWLVCASRRWVVHASDAGYDGLAGTGIRHARLRKYLAHAALPVVWPWGSAYAEGHGEEG